MFGGQRILRRWNAGKYRPDQQPHFKSHYGCWRNQFGRHRDARDGCTSRRRYRELVERRSKRISPTIRHGEGWDDDGKLLDSYQSGIRNHTGDDNRILRQHQRYCVADGFAYRTRKRHRGAGLCSG